MADFQISYSSVSKNGERAVNEDYLDVSIAPDRLGFVLCDGLGGHGNGDIASKFVVERMVDSLQRGASIEDCIMQSQAELLQKQIRENAGNSMKTTVTCLTISQNTARFGHVGDSRVYLFEKGKYIMRSVDHSVPQMLVSRGDIREKDIRHHEDRNRLLRVMGVEWDRPKYQMVDNINITNRTSFLLCSDGFWENIEERWMCKTLKKSKTPEEWIQRMEEIVLSNGLGTNMDNYSALAVFIR